MNEETPTEPTTSAAEDEMKRKLDGEYQSSADFPNETDQNQNSFLHRIRICCYDDYDKTPPPSISDEEDEEGLTEIKNINEDGASGVDMPIIQNYNVIDEFKKWIPAFDSDVGYCDILYKFSEIVTANGNEIVLITISQNRQTKIILKPDYTVYYREIGENEPGNTEKTKLLKASESHVVKLGIFLLMYSRIIDIINKTTKQYRALKGINYSSVSDTQKDNIIEKECKTCIQKHKDTETLESALCKLYPQLRVPKIFAKIKVNNKMKSIIQCPGTQSFFGKPSKWSYTIASTINVKMNQIYTDQMQVLLSDAQPEIYKKMMDHIIWAVETECNKHETQTTGCFVTESVPLLEFAREETKEVRKYLLMDHNSNTKGDFDKVDNSEKKINDVEESNIRLYKTPRTDLRRSNQRLRSNKSFYYFCYLKSFSHRQTLEDDLRRRAIAHKTRVHHFPGFGKYIGVMIPDFAGVPANRRTGVLPTEGEKQQLRNIYHRLQATEDVLNEQIQIGSCYHSKKDLTKTVKITKEEIQKDRLEVGKILEQGFIEQEDAVDYATPWFRYWTSKFTDYWEDYCDDSDDDEDDDDDEISESEVFMVEETCDCNKK